MTLKPGIQFLHNHPFAAEIYRKKTGLILILLFLCCAGHPQFVPPQQFPDDRQDIPRPRPRQVKWLRDSFKNTFSSKIKHAFDLTRYLNRKARQAINVDAMGEVANSSWFSNRNATTSLSIEEIMRGPNTSTGPDTSLPLTITGGRMTGLTPRLYVRDSKERRYELKFDPPGYAELATGAEIISSKVFYAAGYNVPENYIITISQNNLILPDDAVLIDDMGRPKVMSQHDLYILFSRIEKKDTKFRALATQEVDGDPVGGFFFEGVRRDDRNDFIPHEHRRELRGLFVLCSWINYTDAHAKLTEDYYIRENDHRYIKHYFMDFSSSMGGSLYSPADPYKGHENFIDPAAIIWRILTLGLSVAPWEKNTVLHPSIGIFNSAYFDPPKFKSTFPNKAFQNCTKQDGYWGARLVTSFTDEQIAALVSTACYSRQQTGDYIVKTLKERRDKTGRFWYQIVSPVDHFKLIDKHDKILLSFSDTAVESHLWSGDHCIYEYKILIDAKTVRDWTVVEQKNCIELDRVNFTAPFRQALILIRVRRVTQKEWAEPVCVYLSRNPETSILGVQRQVHGSVGF